MKRISTFAVFLTISLASPIAAAPLATTHHTTTPLSRTSREGEVFGRAHRLIAVEDGSRWALHPVKARDEPQAIGATRFLRDGTVRLFLASDFLPAGTLPIGYVGQIYGVTQLGSKKLALAIGWADAERNSHNAIVVASVSAAGTIATQHVVELAGVADVVAGPGNSILAVTSDASRGGAAPLLTVLSEDGVVLGEFFPAAAADVVGGAMNASDARLRHAAGNRYALYDPSRALVHRFSVTIGSAAPRRASVQVEGDVPVTELGVADAARARVLDLYAARNGGIALVRTGRFDKHAATLVTLYAADGRTRGTWLSEPWRLMFVEANTFVGVIARDELTLDSVAFAVLD